MGLCRNVYMMRNGKKHTKKRFVMHFGTHIEHNIHIYSFLISSAEFLQIMVHISRCDIYLVLVVRGGVCVFVFTKITLTSSRASTHHQLRSQSVRLPGAHSLCIGPDDARFVAIHGGQHGVERMPTDRRHADAAKEKAPRAWGC